MPETQSERVRSLVHQRLQVPAQLSAGLRNALTAGYRDDILRLQDRLGRDLMHWLKEAHD